LAQAQTYFDIDLNSVRSGVIPTEEIDHVYVLDLPAGVTVLRVFVHAGGDDADLAVYYGFREEELFYDISSEPNPSATFEAPRPGRYEIYVKNLLWQPLTYELTVSTSTAPNAAPKPGTGPAAGGSGSLAPALSIHAAASAPGEALHVDFSGAPGNARDWIGLYREEATDRAYLTWQYLDGQRTGQLSFVAPAELGRYQFRLFENDGYSRLATSHPFEVRTSPAPGATALSVPCDQLANRPPLAELVVGASVVLACPADCAPSGRLWGTDVYTDDSQVCLAARHAGAIGPEGGIFAITIGAGQSSYEASTRHGATAAGWGPWGRSFGIASAAGSSSVDGATAAPLAGTWRVNANGHRGTLIFDAGPAGWQGTFDLGRVERLEEVTFDGRTVRFTRPLGASTQAYVGELARDGATLRFSGTFYQGAARTPYPWSAER
jgi:hypothetical protein